MVRNHKLGNQAGYTLLELLVSVALGGIILGTLTTSFISQSKSYDAQEQINEMQQMGGALTVLVFVIQPRFKYLQTWWNPQTGLRMERMRI